MNVQFICDITALILRVYSVFFIFLNMLATLLFLRETIFMDSAAARQSVMFSSLIDRWNGLDRSLR